MTSSAPINSLPSMLYLLSIDLDKDQVPDRQKVGYVLRAAALVELDRRGNLTDVDGKVHVARDDATGDPVLDQVTRRSCQGPQP